MKYERLKNNFQEEKKKSIEKKRLNFKKEKEILS